MRVHWRGYVIIVVIAPKKSGSDRVCNGQRSHVQRHKKYHHIAISYKTRHSFQSGSEQWFPAGIKLRDTVAATHTKNSQYG